MASLTSSVPMLNCDLRATSIDRLRAKKRKTRYRYTNMAEVGRIDPIFEEKEPQWNDRNKWKMRNRNYRCRCDSCKADTVTPRKGLRLRPEDYCELNLPSSSCSSSNFTSEFDDGTIPGVLYSYESRRGPSAGSDILSQALGKAVEKMQRKELEKLVREEYDIVEEADTDDSLGSSDDDYELL